MPFSGFTPKFTTLFTSYPSIQVSPEKLPCCVIGNGGACSGSRCLWLGRTLRTVGISICPCSWWLLPSELLCQALLLEDPSLSFPFARSCLWQTLSESCLPKEQLQGQQGVSADTPRNWTGFFPICQLWLALKQATSTNSRIHWDKGCTLQQRTLTALPGTAVGQPGPSPSASLTTWAGRWSRCRDLSAVPPAAAPAACRRWVPASHCLPPPGTGTSCAVLRWGCLQSGGEAKWVRVCRWGLGGEICGICVWGSWSGKKQACCSTWTYWPILIVVMKNLMEQHVREHVAGAEICTGDGMDLEWKSKATGFIK